MGRDTSESDSELSCCGISVMENDPTNCMSSVCKNKYPNQQHKAKIHRCNHAGCDKAFYRPSKLAAHLLLHENKRPYICKIPDCNKAYSNSSHLKRHVQTRHNQSTVVASFRCPEPGCDAVLKTKQFLMRHLKRKHIDFPFECPDCCKKFKRNHQLKEHSFVHSGVHPYRCETCDRGFEKQYDLKRHQRSHRTYSCKLQSCNEEFKTMSLYRKHLSRVHRPIHMCAICNKEFSTHSNLNVHLSGSHFPSLVSWKCDVESCGLTFAQERYLKQHTEHLHHKLHDYTCPVKDCNKVFNWRKSFYKHVKQHNVTRVTLPKKKAKERKDKGVPKVSMAIELANIELPLNCHKELISRETVDSDDTKSDISFVSAVTI